MESLNELFFSLEKKIDELIFSEIKKERKYLYHYTELNGFFGIFNTKSLKASNAYFLNDSSEVEYGLKISKKYLEEFYHSIKDDQIKAALKGFYDNYSEYFLCCNLFLVSFSENGDLLSQWRGYTTNEGISLGFDKEILKRLHNVYLKKVIYEEELQKQIIIFLFDILNNIVEQSEKNIEIFRLYFKLWITEFMKILLTFKDNNFFEEKEWRLIYYIDDINENNKNISFRIKNNYLLPYIEIENLDIDKLIRQIIFGPSTDNSIFRKSIKYYLNINNYRKKIINSKIPFRK